VYGQWKQSGVKFVGIGLLDTKEACQAFVQRHHLSFPNGYDRDGTVARRYGFTYQPYWAVIVLRPEARLEEPSVLVVATIKNLTGR